MCRLYVYIYNYIIMFIYYRWLCVYYCLLLYCLFMHIWRIHSDIHNESLNAGEYVIDLGDGFLWCFFRHGTMGIAPLRFLTKLPNLLMTSVSLCKVKVGCVCASKRWCRLMQQALLEASCPPLPRQGISPKYSSMKRHPRSGIEVYWACSNKDSRIKWAHRFAYRRWWDSSNW